MGWAGCAGHEILRMPTAVLSLVGIAATQFLLQYCILAKVEALSSASGKPHRTARFWFHVMLNPMTPLVGVFSSILPLGVGRALHDRVMQLQMLFIIFFMSALAAFTCSAVASMLHCLSRLSDGTLELSKDARRRMRRLI